MVNAPFTFICGLIWLAVTFKLQSEGVNALAVVATFFFALYWLIPLTLLQMPDDFVITTSMRGKSKKS